MARKIVRTMEAYSVHGHLRPGSDMEELLDYGSFFRAITQADPHRLRYPVGDATVAVANLQSSERQIAIRFVSGNADELPLVYDLSTATAHEVDPGKDRFVVNSAWVILTPDARIAVLERKRPGVPVFQIERFLSEFGQRHLEIPALSISLNPVPSASFAHEVAQFTRIREASITLRRPNHSWTRNAESMLGNLAESNAAEIQLQLNADRGQSLSKAQGIVREVIRLSRNPINALKNAVVRGNTPTFEGERTVSLSKHTVKGTALIDPTDDPSAQLEPLANVAGELTRLVLEGPDMTGILEIEDSRIGGPTEIEPRYE